MRDNERRTVNDYRTLKVTRSFKPSLNVKEKILNFPEMILSTHFKLKAI
jgi:hypothetical protein